MILVDSNVWRQTENPGGDPDVRGWLAANDRETVLSALVLAEMRFGVALMAGGKKRQRIDEWLNALAQSYRGNILPFDGACADQFGRLAAFAKQSGRNVSTIDLQLAAQAAAYGMAIATRNVKDFAGFDIELINPWSS